MTQRYSFKWLPTVGLIVCVFLLVQAAGGQIPEKDFYKMIAAAGWLPEELKAIENGETVVRSVETKEKQELATIGILRIKGLPAVSMAAFREALSQQGGGSMKAGGMFGDPPSVDDLRELHLDKDSIEQLRKCTIGDCDLNLSAEMIRRFQSEIDWDSPEAETNATRLIREMVVGYVTGYSARGDGALGGYDNRRKPVDLVSSHRLLLSNSLFIGELAPELVEYLAKFPAGKTNSVESSMHWSVVDFGLKPSITVSHSAVYTRVIGDAEQLFVASKQIYASRYLDSSLTFTILLRVASETGVDTYLIFTDRSSSDVLDGALGGFARGMVKKESIERTKTLLDKIHVRLLAALRPTARTSSADTDDSLIGRVLALARKRPFLLSVLLLAMAALFFLWRRNRAPA